MALARDWRLPDAFIDYLGHCRFINSLVDCAFHSLRTAKPRREPAMSNFAGNFTPAPVQFFAITLEGVALGQEP